MHQHVTEPVENQRGNVIAKRCVQCLLVVDMRGKRVLDGVAHSNPWEVETGQCVRCKGDFYTPAAYLRRRKYCGSKCRGKAAYTRRKARSLTA